MAILARMSRLFSADFHAVLDRLEEPEALLKQAIREMSDELGAEKSQLAAQEHEQSVLVTRKARHESRIAELDAELDLCFDDDNEALARKLVRRKLQLQRLVQELASRLERLEAETRVARERLEANEARLAEMREKAEIVAEPLRAEPGIPGCEWSEPGIGDDEVEAAFLRERQGRRRT